MMMTLMMNLLKMVSWLSRSPVLEILPISQLSKLYFLLNQFFQGCNDVVFLSMLFGGGLTPDIVKQLNDEQFYYYVPFLIQYDKKSKRVYVLFCCYFCYQF